MKREIVERLLREGNITESEAIELGYEKPRLLQSEQVQECKGLAKPKELTVEEMIACCSFFPIAIL